MTARRDGDPHAAAADAAAALALWRGAALQGLTDAPWFGAEARRLDALRLDAREERFEAALAVGEHREVAAELRAALDENPYRERLWGQLMLALYRSGRQADALDAFLEARRVLSDGLGLEPGPELRSLQEAILGQDPAIAAVPVVSMRRGNLPAPSTSFVGREAELAQVAGLLAEHRVVTLTGPPGVGKSRTALEAVRPLEDSVSDGIWFIDLARAAAPADVTRLLARAVDARGGVQLERVVERLRDAEAILVFDSCERLLAEVRRVVEEVIRGCPGVRVVATSREVLRVTGEARVTVEPLPLASPQSDDDADSPAVGTLPGACAGRPAWVSARHRDGSPGRCHRQERRRLAACHRAGRGEGERARTRRAALAGRAAPGACFTSSPPPTPARRCVRSSSGATTSCTPTRRRYCTSSRCTAAEARSRR